MSTDKGADYICEEPCGRDRRASEIEYLFPVSFPLVGNPSDCSRSQERFWTSQNDRNKELRQIPQGVQFIKNVTLLSNNIKRRRRWKDQRTKKMLWS